MRGDKHGFFLTRLWCTLWHHPWTGCEALSHDAPHQPCHLQPLRKRTMRSMKAEIRKQANHNAAKTQLSLTCVNLEFSSIKCVERDQMNNKPSKMTKSFVETSPKLEMPQTPRCINGTSLVSIIHTETYISIVCKRHNMVATFSNCIM